jgi:hypothetical protein
MRVWVDGLIVSPHRVIDPPQARQGEVQVLLPTPGDSWVGRGGFLSVVADWRRPALLSRISGGLLKGPDRPTREATRVHGVVGGDDDRDPALELEDTNKGPRHRHVIPARAAAAPALNNRVAGSPGPPLRWLTDCSLTSWLDHGDDHA